MQRVTEEGGGGSADSPDLAFRARGGTSGTSLLSP
jgi:hypothetical protein